MCGFCTLIKKEDKLANKKKFKDPVRKVFLIEREYADFISDYSKASFRPEGDFIAEAVIDKINRIKLEDTLNEESDVIS